MTAAASDVTKLLAFADTLADAARTAMIEQVADALGVAAQVKKLLVMLVQRRKLVLAKDLADAYQERLLAHQNIVRAVMQGAQAMGV